MKTKLLIQISVCLELAIANSLFAQWVQANGPYYNPGSPLIVYGDNIVVAYVNEIVRSTDNGTTWISAGKIFPRAGLVNSLTMKGDTLFAATYSGIYLSSDNGTNWSPSNNGLPTSTSVQSIIVIPDSPHNLFAGTSRGVYLSTDGGSNWTATNAGLTDTVVNCLVFNGTKLFAGTGNGLFSSTDNGLNWQSADSGLTVSSINCLACRGMNLFAGTTSGIFLSTDNGESWISAGLSGRLIQTLVFNDSTLYAGTIDGLFLTVDDGSTWISGHLPTNVFSIGIKESNIFVSGSGGIFLSTNETSSWTCMTGRTVLSEFAFTRKDTNLFVGASYGVFRSTDNGESWLPAGLPRKIVTSLAVRDSALFAYSGDLFISTNDGEEWNPVNLPEDTTEYPYYVTSFMVNDTNLYISTADNKIFVSTDDGANWVLVGNGIPDIPFGGLIADPDSSNIFYAWTAYNGVFKSTDKGSNWTAVNSGLTDTSITLLAFCDKTLFAGTTAGIFRTNNKGATWTAVSGAFSNLYICSFAADPSIPGNFFIGSYSGSVFFMENYGSKWKGVNLGSDYGVNALAVCGTNLVAGTNGSNVWFRPMSEIITSVGRNTNNIAADYLLRQNYPNPFNPSTTIEFDIPKSGFVSLKVYNIMGQEITTLINKELSSGIHNIHWNAAGLASGMYLYRLQAGNYTDTKKLILLR